MELQTDFAAFLEEIRPTPTQRSELQDGHQRLRERLKSFEELKPIYVADFLQGSYRRSTAVRPKNDQRSDVDIIIVTNIDERVHTPATAMGLFKPFLKKYYDGKWQSQGRSFGIEMSTISLDLVITSAPVEAARARTLAEDIATEPEWKFGPLRIPDRKAGIWENTHPLEQIRWTRTKNANTYGHFGNVVKAIKWWRLENHEKPKHPKGFPLERLIGECCPDDIASVAEGVTRTLESIVSKYRYQATAGDKPRLPDYGVPTHDVFARIEADDFAKFYAQVEAAAKIAREAFNSQDRTFSGNRWRDLFGSKFPKPPDDGSGKKTGFTSPTQPAVPGSGRFA